MALVVCQCSSNWGREEGTIPSVHIPQRMHTPAKDLSPSAREEFECRPVTEQLKDWPSSQQRDEYDMLKQVMPIAYDANKLDLRTNSCCLPVWLFIQPSLVSVF